MREKRVKVFRRPLHAAKAAWVADATGYGEADAYETHWASLACFLLFRNKNTSEFFSVARWGARIETFRVSGAADGGSAPPPEDLSSYRMGNHVD